MNKNNAGFNAKQLAATFLINNGPKLVTRNYHCSFGEVYLIMQEAKILVLVEVRLHSNNHFDNAGASITKNKQKNSS